MSVFLYIHFQHVNILIKRFVLFVLARRIPFDLYDFTRLFYVFNADFITVVDDAPSCAALRFPISAIIKERSSPS